MPYITKSEHRRAESRKEWMTLTEATHYICEKESCELSVALRQLFLAIVDGDVQVKRGWVDPDLTVRISPSEFQRALKICLKDRGYVKIIRDSRKSQHPSITVVSPSRFSFRRRYGGDHAAGEDPLDYAPLWLCRADVTRIWSGEACQTINHEARSAKSRKQRASEKAILEVARKIYKEHSNKPPNLRKAETLIREQLPGATRKQIEPILKQSEFADLRHPPGRQPKR